MEDPIIPEVAPIEPAPNTTDPTITPEVVEPITEDPIVEPEEVEPKDPEVDPAPELPAPKEVEVDAEIEAKRLKGAVDKAASLGEEMKRMVDMQAEFVKDDPNMIHRIADRDPLLANRIVEKVWVSQGIKSYRQLTELIKIEDLKDKNPDLYEIKKELFDLRLETATKREEERKVKEKTFLSSKGIMVNEYDPNYKKVMSALELIDPKVRKNDPDSAVKAAYGIAFADNKPVIAPKVAPAPMKVGGGASAPALPPKGDALSADSAWLAKGLAEIRKKKI